MLMRAEVDGTTTDGYPAHVVIDVTLPDPTPTPTPTPAPAAPAMVVGATAVDDDFLQFDRAAGGRNAGAAFCRTFSPPGAAIVSWTSPRRKLPAIVADFHSFKDWPSDDAAVAMVTGYLDSMPRLLLDGPPLLPELRVYDPDGYSDGRSECDGFSALLSYCHEGENNFISAGLTVREWRRRHRLIYKTIRQHANGHRVGYMPIQTGTWTLAASTRGRIKGDFDPLAWWAGVGDYAGWDAYVPSNTTSPPGPTLYPAPAEFFELPVQLARSTGRRLFLPELGVIRQGSGAGSGAGDDGTYRAQWITAAVGYLDAQGCAGVAWWDALGTNNRDFRLTDQKSAQAWTDAIAGVR